MISFSIFDDDGEGLGLLKAFDEMPGGYDDGPRKLGVDVTPFDLEPVRTSPVVRLVNPVDSGEEILVDYAPPVDVPPPRKKLLGEGTTGNCNCYTGAAYLDAAGGCKCHPNSNVPPFPFGGSEAEQIAWRKEWVGVVNPIEEPPPGTGGVKAPKGMKWTPAGWVPMVSNTKGTATTSSEENTIFGFSPWVVLGAAAVGLWMISSMGGEK